MNTFIIFSTYGAVECDLAKFSQSEWPHSSQPVSKVFDRTRDSPNAELDLRLPNLPKCNRITASNSEVQL